MPDHPTFPAVLELRQYLLRQGRRDELIELFDRELVEPQEVEGMQVIGQFRDIDRPNRFVWLRGFASHQQRNAALTSFYGGPVWRRFGPAANATMIDSDDVLLLRPAVATADRPSIPTPPDGDGSGRPRGVVIVIVHRRPGSGEATDRVVSPLLERFAAAADLTLVGALGTDPTPNGFPALPVRTADCLVLLGTTPSPAGLDRVAEASVDLRAELRENTGDQPGEIHIEIRRLVPTDRSRLGR